MCYSSYLPAKVLLFAEAESNTAVDAKTTVLWLYHIIHEIFHYFVKISELLCFACMSNSYNQLI